MSIQITPKLWGPYCWNFLHSISKNYNSKYKKKYYYFIKKIKFILPCPVCQEHFKQYLEDNNVELQKINKQYLEKWFFKLHNHINKKLYKKEISFKEAKKEIDNKKYTNNNYIFTFFYFINNFFLKHSLSINHFNNIKSMYKLMGYIYPDNIIKQNFYNLTNNISFQGISNEKELNDWFNNNINIEKLI